MQIKEFLVPCFASAMNAMSPEQIILFFYLFLLLY